ncbi:MAG: hypothetical protein KC621_24680 [Myxococcales bacterium]|nr:hypothetical protein [Myxococcales bacterium]
MLHADARFGDAVKRKVEELEARTDAEVVVVAAERSGSYRDLSVLAGAGASLLMFVVLSVLPWPVDPVLATLDLLVTFVVVGFALDGRRMLLGLAPRTRRHQQVSLSAAAEFYREAVHATPRRTGLLVYVSAAEGEVELIPDVGIEARVPRAAWVDAVQRLSATDLDGFLRGLDEIGVVLAEHVPPAGERGVSLSNAPRIRA